MLFSLPLNLISEVICINKGGMGREVKGIYVKGWGCESLFLCVFFFFFFFSS